MSVAIIPLPGAAAAPIPAPKLGPGRPPKNVSSIRRGKWIRDGRHNRLARAAQLEAEAQELRAWVAYWAPEYLAQAADLEAQARALRQGH